MNNWIDLEQQYTSGVYGKRPVCFVRGEGARLWDDAGREYDDFAAGIAVANIGHAHPRLTAALVAQATQLISAPELGYNDVRARYLARLAQVVPDGLDRFFLCNSGTEAIEAALKFAQLTTGRSHFVATMRGFHGRTLGALALTHEKKYRAPFEALLPRFEHVPFNHIDKLAGAVNRQTAGVVIELVQGEGGVRPAEADFVAAARDLCDRHGALLIIDEVQTGFGRTGRLFACDLYGVQPDVLALGKAIAGGVPMGAAALGPRVGELPVGAHGSTFGGNPLACAAALATLDIVHEERLPERAAERGAYLRDQLAAIDSPLVREVRGVGLMIGMELRVRVQGVLEKLLARGFLVLNAGTTVLRFLPPLVIDQVAIDRLVPALRDVLAEVAAEEGA